MTSDHRARRFAIVASLSVVLVVAAAGTAAAQVSGPAPKAPCFIQGSWLAEVDIGARFFVSYSRGADAGSGPLAVEWIAGDPTLFGAFPSAVALTQGVGVWRRVDGHSYQYTWISYGLDATGTPVYAWRGSGTGVLQGCDMIVFDYVADIFPMPLNPLVDDPASCISGAGIKYRISVVTGECS